jgi:hypothetical protein
VHRPRAEVNEPREQQPRARRRAVPAPDPPRDADPEDVAPTPSAQRPRLWRARRTCGAARGAAHVPLHALPLHHGSARRVRGLAHARGRAPVAPVYEHCVALLDDGDALLRQWPRSRSCEGGRGTTMCACLVSTAGRRTDSLACSPTTRPKSARRCSSRSVRTAAPGRAPCPAATVPAATAPAVAAAAAGTGVPPKHSLLDILHNSYPSLVGSAG